MLWPGEDELQARDFLAENVDLVVKTVDCALRGSEYGLQAWGLIKKLLSAGRKPTGEELERLDELIDRAEDDLEGPGLRIDFSKDRVY